jgi:hypothetical protein
MKLSVSVPDDLWERAHTPGDSPSATVQRALRVLCESLPSEENPLPRAAGYYEIPGVDGGRAYAMEVLGGLAKDAEGQRGNGYSIGIEVVRKAGWQVLDLLPGEDALLRVLSDWQYAGVDGLETWVPEEDALEVLEEALADGLGGYSDEIALGRGVPIPSSIALGIVQAIGDVQATVRRQLRNPAKFKGDDEQQESAQ